MQTTRRARYFAALAATTLALSACGGGDDDSSDETSSDTSTTQSESTGDEATGEEDSTDDTDSGDDEDQDEADSSEDESSDESEEAAADGGSEGSVTASKSGVSFDVPDGWTSVDPSELLEDSGDTPKEFEDLAESQGVDADTYLQTVAQSVDVMVIGETKSNFSENVNVISSPTKPTKESSTSELEQVGATVEGTEEVDTELGSGFDTTYTLSANGQEVHGRSLMVPTDSGAALITVSATSADSADEVATTILDSIDKA